MENKLSNRHLSELQKSALTDDWIETSGARTISVKEAVDLGFYAKSPHGEKLLQTSYVNDCLYLPFYSPEGKEVLDPITNKLVGVIKPSYTISANTLIDPKKEKLPKYLCKTKSNQKHMAIHFPKNFNWSEFFNMGMPRRVFITEGWKKAEAACSKGIPTVAVWSIWCFGEEGTDSPLIPELKNLIIDHDLVPYIVFDSDKAYKEPVINAERSFVEKIYSETGVEAKVVDLPQSVEGQTTKGLDDYLMVQSAADFDHLVNAARTPLTPFMLTKKFTSTPKAPVNALPEAMRNMVLETVEKFEGCHEVSVMSLLCSYAIVLRNRVKIEGRNPNLYCVGIAPTTSGKTTVAKAAIKPLKNLHKQLIIEFQKELSKGSEDNNEEPNDGNE